MKWARVFSLCLICLCNTFSQNKSLRGSTTDYIQEMVNAVSQDSLLSYIGALQSFGSRFEYTPQQELAATYILNSMTNAGAQAASDPYAFGTNYICDVDLVDSATLRAVGTAGTAIFSNDGGATWTAGTVPSGTTILNGVKFFNAQHGWAVGWSDKINMTTDGGANWIAQSTGVTNSFYDVGFFDDTAGIVVGSEGKILRTSNGGSTWSSITSGTNQYLQELCIVDAAHVWVVGDWGTILFSSDKGFTWTTQTSGVSFGLMGLDFVDAKDGWAVGGYGTILHTTDGGLLWNSIDPPIEMKSYFHSVCFWSATEGLLLDHYGLIFKTTDGGTSWTKVYSTLNLGWGPYLYRIKRFGSRRFIAVGGSGLVVTSTNEGNSWTQLTQNLPSSIIHNSRNIIATIPGTVTPEKECVMVAHYDSYSSTNITETAPGANDNGSGTSAVMEAVRILRNYTFESTVKLIAVSGEELGMFGSSYYARRANEQHRNIVGAVNGDMIGYPTTPDTTRLVLGSYLSYNRLIDSALIYNQRYDIGLTLATMIDSTGASDYGPFAIAGYDALEIAEATANEIWGGADPFYHTPNDSLSKLCPSLIRRGAQLMAATVAELAKPIGRLTSIGATENQLPKQFSLEQNFPNPFNPTTEIRFTLKDAGWVTLTVFDLLGREVSFLCHKEYKPGTYKITWNASTVPSGVYFYQLKTGKFSETKKMLLIR
jgi:photosystem II stability/assembly factor-like uncharacterized protein